MKKLLKSIYDFLPFKKQLFTFLKKVYIPGESVYRHLHFHGVIDIKVDKNTSFKMNHEGYQIENEIFWSGLEGGWEKVSVGIWVKLARNAKTVFDIGANTGVFGLMAKALNPGAQVYAFEPVLRVHDKLAKNIALNKFDIKSFPVAISNATGKAHIFDVPAHSNVYSVTVNKNLDPNPHSGQVKTEIDTVTLDSFIDTHHITGIDLMKIDVETHEGEVMEGFAEHLKQFRPTLLIEILRNEVGEKVQSSLSGMGYLYFNIDENGDVLRVDSIQRRGHNYNYLLCAPDIASQLGLNNYNK